MDERETACSGSGCACGAGWTGLAADDPDEGEDAVRSFRDDQSRPAAGLYGGSAASAVECSGTGVSF